MKKFSKLLALLLALAMVFCLAACEKDDDDDRSSKKSKETTGTTEPDSNVTPAPAPTDEEVLIGTWSYKADLSDVMGTTLAAAMGDASLAPDAPLYMEIAFAFNENGKATLTAKVDQESFTDYMDALVDKMVSFMYATAEAQGMSKADFDAAIEAEAGMSLKELMETQMDAALADSMDEMETTSDLLYKVDSAKGIIYVGEDQSELDAAADGMNYKLDGSKLTVSDIFGEDIEEAKAGLESFGLELPWVFEKQ